MAPKVIRWPPPPVRLSPEYDDVHIWAASLTPLPTALNNLRRTLSPEERDRAAKFRFDKHRDRYVAGRGILRAILGRYLSMSPARLALVYSSLGKPALSPDFDGAGIFFNLAHSEDLALVAVTRLGPIGVDVEHIRRIKNIEELVARFFSKRESAAFQKLSPVEQPVAFFNLWTRKEAYLKATGEGITQSLNRVEVSFLNHEPARFLSIAADPQSAREWSLENLSPAEDFVGAVAVRSAQVRVHAWKWE